MNRTFQKNPKYIQYGNHASTVNCESCTICGIDIANPLVENCNYICPHTTKAEPRWKIGDRVRTVGDDKTMGPAEIVCFQPHKHYGGIAILHYFKYDEEAVPCYRQAWVNDLLPWEEAEEQQKIPKTDHIPTLRQILNGVLKAWKEEGLTLEDI